MRVWRAATQTQPIHTGVHSHIIPRWLPWLHARVLPAATGKGGVMRPVCCPASDERWLRRTHAVHCPLIGVHLSGYGESKNKERKSSSLIGVYDGAASSSMTAAQDTHNLSRDIPVILSAGITVHRSSTPRQVVGPRRKIEAHKLNEKVPKIRSARSFTLGDGGKYSSSCKPQTASTTQRI